jgi:hypothetical protein
MTKDEYKQLYENVCEQYDILAKELDAIKQALAAPEQKYLGVKPCWYESKEEKMCPKCGQVHAGAIFSAAQRQWVGLEREIAAAVLDHCYGHGGVSDDMIERTTEVIEAKLKENT